jgi:hypothetical protein
MLILSYYPIPILVIGLKEVVWNFLGSIHLAKLSFLEVDGVFFDPF